MKTIPVQFQNHEGVTIRGQVHLPQNYDGRTALVYLHGFPGTMMGSASRFLPLFTKLGFLCLRFDFSGSNTSDGKFEDKLMSTEVQEIKCAIDFLEKNYHFKKLVLVGISTGAIDATLYGSKDKRVSAVVLLGGVSDLKHAVRYDFNDQQVHDFWTKGYIRYNRPGSWYHRQKLKKAFYDEFFTLNLPKAIKKYKKPLLIIHGEKDESVPLFNAKQLYKLANRPKKLVIIKGADHRFSKLRWKMKVLWEIYKFARAR